MQNDEKTIVCDGPVQKMLTEDVMMDYSSIDVFFFLIRLLFILYLFFIKCKARC